MLLHGAFVPEDWALLYPFFLFATAFWHILITLSPTSMVPDVTLTDVTIFPPLWPITDRVDLGHNSVTLVHINRRIHT